MFKKIAAAAVLAGALAFSAAAPAVLSAGSISDNTGAAVASGNWPNPVSVKVKVEKDKKSTGTAIVPLSGNWPNPV
jgi:hypothetical protein